MEHERMQSWLAASLSDYTQDRIKAGESREQAVATAKQSYATLFPDGNPAAGHHVFDVQNDDGVIVGFLWIGPQSEGPPEAWWVWDIAIEEDQRGKGYGRETMRLGEGEVLLRGGTDLGLHVFGFNTTARALYESMGYEPTSIRMSKKLT